jgi:hypothetical protein
MNQKIKNLLKLFGILIVIFLLLNVFNFFNPKSRNGFRKNSAINNYSTNEKVSVRNGIESMNQTAPMTDISEDLSIEPIKSSENLNIIDKKIIKNGDLNLKIKNVENAVKEITQITENQNGEVFSTNFSERVKGQKSGFMTIKVPVDKFEKTLNEIKNVATQVLSESTTGQDVTEQYSDLQAQLKNKRAEEESFIKILDRAGEIKDVLAVTKELSRVRGEIERLEGRIRFMDSQTEMSTIVINLNEDITLNPKSNDWRPWQIVKESFKELTDNSQDFINSIIRFIIVGIPSIITFLIIAGILYWAGKKIWIKMKK